MSKYFSECRNLQLLPIDRIAQFWQTACRAGMIAVGGEFSPTEIPGTVAVKCQMNGNGAWETEIDFESISDGPLLLAALEILTKTDVIAMYTDQRGNRRVAGSLSYPLSLSIETTGALIHGRLNGTSDMPNGYLEA